MQASLTIGRNTADLLNETKINNDLQSVSKDNIEERVLEAISVLEAGVKSAKTEKAAAGSWVMFIGLGLVATILLSLVYWIWRRKRDPRLGRMAVATDDAN